MTCPQCGHDENLDGAERCAVCDASLEPDDPVTALGRPASTSSEPSEKDKDGTHVISGQEETVVGQPSVIGTDVRTALAPARSGQLPVLESFGERFEILELLGQGGMGRVYKAWDRELEKVVALKTIRGEGGDDPELLKRFKQELLLARQITHKNVIRIHDLGDFQGVRYFTMEYIEGDSLKEYIRKIR